MTMKKILNDIRRWCVIALQILLYAIAAPFALPVVVLAGLAHLLGEIE